MSAVSWSRISLTQQRAQRVRERQPDLLVDRYLRHARQLVLDRILDRDDLLATRPDPVDRRVQCRRLARARRSGRQHDAVRLRDDGAELLQRVRRHAQLGEVDAAALLVQQPQHDALAVQCRKRRHADIDLTVAHAQPDAAVLRHSPFRDVQLGHDLQPADDRGGKPARWRGRIEQDTVDAVPHAQSADVRFEVNVRRPRFECLEEQQVHQLHDRRFIGEADEVVERCIGFADRSDLVRQPCDHILGGQRVRRVDASNRGAHLLLRHPHQLE
jgi:hypothetical protein